MDGSGCELANRYRRKKGISYSTVRLSDVEPWQPRVRKSLRGLEINATWADLLAAEPRLQAFMDEVMAIKGTSWETCPESLWFGWASRDPRKGIKGRLGAFVGHDSVPFHAAYRALYGSLKTCMHCIERDLLEADIEANVAIRLHRRGIRPVQRQVHCQAGIADIVTADTVYEIKLDLSRSSLFSAIGQVSVYARELERPNRVIVGRQTPETGRLIESVRKLGIKVELW